MHSVAEWQPPYWQNPRAGDIVRWDANGEHGAIFNAAETERYVLWRKFAWKQRTEAVDLGAEPWHPLVVIALNPSTADHEANDPTIRRCIDFAFRHQRNGLVMLNLFSQRSTDPKLLRSRAGDLSVNRGYIQSYAAQGVVLAAWGNHGGLYKRGREVLAALTGIGIPVYCLGTTGQGFPKHPLYVPAVQPFVAYNEVALRGEEPEAAMQAQPQEEHA